MKNSRSVTSILVSAAASLLALASAGAAQAQDVYWSVGLSSPGVHMGVSNALPVRVAPPVYYQPRPVYVAPPAYFQPRPVYVAPRPMVYVRPLPVFVPPPRYFRTDWRQPGYRQGWQHWEQRQQMERFGHGEHDRRR